MAWRFWHLPSVMNLIGCGTDQEPAKVCRRGFEIRRESKWKSIEIKLWLWLWISDIIWWISHGSLMDLWWFVSFVLSTFDVFVQGNTPYDPFPGGGWRNSMKWYVSKKSQPHQPCSCQLRVWHEGLRVHYQETWGGEGKRELGHWKQRKPGVFSAIKKEWRGSGCMKHSPRKTQGSQNRIWQKESKIVPLKDKLNWK